ncbi:MAG: L-histidine N(alpha)-methyltransferase [Gemmatimonadota bacterium]
MKIVQAVAGTGAVTLYDFEPTPDRICDDVARGLARAPRKLPPKYFYDERGATLFEQITRIEAYYPTRTEISILEGNADEIAARIGAGVRLVEFGSGSGEKTWLILRSLESPTAYVPVDISRTQLVEFAIRVAEAFPELRVDAVCADYTAEYSLPPDSAGTRRSVALFPGSTIGNFEPGEAEAFLRRVRRLVGASGGLLLGVDLRKDPAIVERAYNDPEGVTAEFNLNLLQRINRECGADFDVTGFRHHAFFDDAAGRVEMRLVAESEQLVNIPTAGEDASAHQVHFAAGDYITTEYSHKYDRIAFADLATCAGWRISAEWSDDRDWFSVMLLE